MKNSFKIFRWALAWTLIVTILSGIPGKQVPSLGFHAEDKVAHFVVYAILAILWLKVWIVNEQKRFTAICIAFVTCVAWGFFMEILQKYCFVDRSFDYYDALANSIGAGLGIAISPLISKILTTLNK